LSPETLTALDLDNVRDPITGNLVPWARELVLACGSYCEVTPSGKGIRILCLASIKATQSKGDHPSGDGAFEIYADCNRYITVSGFQMGLTDFTDLADDTVQVQQLIDLLGYRPPPPPGPDPEPTNGAGPDTGPDRSAEFYRILKTLKEKGGHSVDQIAAGFDAGVAKYRGRLRSEIERVWDKLGPEPEKPKPVLQLRYGWDTTTPQALGTIVRGILHAGSITLFYGPPKSGKSFLATDLFMAIADETRQFWMGQAIVRHGPVLYVTCEGHAGFWKRTTAAAIEYGWTADNFPKNFITATGRPRMIAFDDKVRAFVPRPDDIFDAVEAATAAGYPPIGICIDTVFRSFGGGNVSSSVDMNAYIDSLSRLADRKLAVIPVHHGSRVGGNPSGSIALEGAADTLVPVSRPKKDEDDRVWEVDQAKDDAPIAARKFQLRVVDLGTDPEGQLASSCVIDDLGATDPMRDKTPNSGGRPKNVSERSALLNLLSDVLSRIGQPRTNDPTIPSYVTTIIEVAAWREEFMQRFRPDDEPQTKRTAFRRYLRDFIAEGTVGASGTIVWLKSPPNAVPPPPPNTDDFADEDML